VVSGDAGARWQLSGSARYPLDRAAYEAELVSVRGKLPADEFGVPTTVASPRARGILL
jgi:hypothetical protein